MAPSEASVKFGRSQAIAIREGELALREDAA
jgi:hypothetical protein